MYEAIAARVPRLPAFAVALYCSNFIVERLVDAHAIPESFILELAIFCALWGGMDAAVSACFGQPSLLTRAVCDRPAIRLLPVLPSIAVAEVFFHFYSFTAECCAFAAVLLIFASLTRRIARLLS